jgi:hypothetical protein
MEQKKCSKCRKYLSVSHFIGKNNKETKVCDSCRNIKKIKDARKRDDKMVEVFNPDGRDIQLLECIDKDKLNYILANHEKFDLGSAFINGKKLDKEGQLTLLIYYHNSLNHSGEIDIKYKQKSYGFGRYYGHRKLQLQNICKRIRHTIAQEKMIDIDIKNAHPTLLQWYCKTNNIPCEGLSYYIDNRDKCIQEIMDITGFDKDDVKADLLAIINGRDKYEGQVDDYPQWYIDYYFNVKDITEQVSLLEPQFKRTALKQKKANGKGDYNIGGTTINYLMTDLENKCLMCIYDVCRMEGIKVASLVYDGIMLYKDGLPNNLDHVLKRMEEQIFKVLDGCQVQIIEKPMNEGYDIDYEVMEYKLQSLTHLIKHDESISVMFDKYSTNYIQKVDIDENVRYVKDLEWEKHRKVLCINSCMGSGKTTSICKWIKENNPKRVIVLSPRISFAKSITHEYNEKIGEEQQKFKCYKDMKNSDIATCNRIVISMESLYKISYDFCMKNPFDLVVVDECQANLTSHTCKETNGKNFDLNSEAFYGMLRSSNKILFCDAFINAKTLDFLTYFQLPTLFLNYKRPMDKRKATILESSERSDYDALFPYIIDDLEKDKKVYVCITSAKRASEWALTLERKFPNKSIRLYSKGTGKEITDVRKEWDVDCVITTTTITVGINYDIPNHFNKCYMSFSSKAKNNVVDLFQCHYRVRHLIDNEIMVHIVDMPERNNPCDKTDILNDLKWFELHKKELFDLFELAPLYLKKLLCYNQLEHNLSVSRLTNLVYAFLTECNYDIEIKKTTTEEMPHIISVHEDLTPFSSIPLIEKDEFNVLTLKRGKGVVLDDEDKDKIKKYEFVKFFSDGNPNEWVNNNYDDEFWKIFNEYRQAKLNNIKTEKKVKNDLSGLDSLFRKEHDINQLAVMSSHRSSKVYNMIGILKDLGLDYSQKVGETISKERINDWCEKVRNDETNIRNVFNIRDRRKGKEEMSDKNCITLLNSIFKDFGYTQLKQVNKYVMVNGKKVRDINAPYVIEDFKSHLRGNNLSPNIGMRIYNSFIVDCKVDNKIIEDNPVRLFEGDGVPI